MSITCQITPLTADRMRLHAPHLASQPETRQHLMQLLLAVPAVTGVELQLASDSIVIKYDGAPAARAAILAALRGQPAQREATSGTAAPAETQPAEAQPVATQPAAVPPAAPPPQAKAAPFAKCTLVHAMRGRVRLAIPTLSKEAQLAGLLADFLGQQAGVRQVRLNRRAANLVVTFDPAVLKAEALVGMITAYDPNPAEIARWQAAQRVQGAPLVHHARRRKIEVALAAVALALSLFAGSVAMPVVYILLLGCAGSMLQRTYKGLRTERKLMIEAIAAAAMVLTGLSGALWLAALIPLVLSGAQPVYAWLLAQAPKTGAKVHTAAPARAAIKSAAPALPIQPEVSPGANPNTSAGGNPLPARAVQNERSIRLADQTLTVEPLELGQTFTGVSSLADISTLSGGTTRFVRTNPRPSSQQADR